MDWNLPHSDLARADKNVKKTSKQRANRQWNNTR